MAEVPVASAPRIILSVERNNGGKIFRVSRQIDFLAWQTQRQIGDWWAGKEIDAMLNEIAAPSNE